jgi:hypothetical protein
MSRLLANGRSVASRALSLFIAVVFVCALPSPVFAAGGQFGNLRGGPIEDSATKAPITGARIIASSPSGTYHAVTDSHGLFTILGMNVDTYTITIEAKGYEPISFPGQTLIGDGTLDLGGPWLMTKSLKTIARVSARSPASAFQPSQTIDSYTITQAQIQQTTGKAFSTNENALLLAVPGVTLTNAGTPTVRGGAAYEVGYEYDGVSFKEPFLGTNGSGILGMSGSNSSALFNGISDVQVVEGAGDATQGNVGSGVINLIPARGTYPGSVNTDLEAGTPNFSHQFAGTWSWATPDNRFSDYLSFNGQRYVPYFGYHTTPLDQYGNFFTTHYTANNQFQNNFIFKFGHNQNQSLQVLYLNILQQLYGAQGPGGIFCDPTINAIYGLNGGACPAGTNPNALAYWPYDSIQSLTPVGLPWGILPLAFGLAKSPAQSLLSYVDLLPSMPNTPFTAACAQAATLGSGCLPVPGGQMFNSTTTRFLKFEYDWHIDPSTYLATRYYNWEQLNNADNSYTCGGAWQTGLNGLCPGWSSVGGPTVGASADLTHQITPNLTFQIEGKEDVLHPIWDGYTPGYEMLEMDLPPLSGSTAGFGGLPNAPLLPDFYAGGYLCGGNPQHKAYFDCSQGWANTRIPTWGIGYNKTFFQNWGYGLRFMYDPGTRVHLDLGVRDEGQNRHWFNQLDQYGLALPPDITCIKGVLVAGKQCSPLGQDIKTNPYDVPGPQWVGPNATPFQNVWQPRGSIDYELGRNDAIRFGYGRSAVFANAQTAGTPFHMYGLQNFIGIPAKAGSYCGWLATVAIPAGHPGCTSYAQQLYWNGDNLEAPDALNPPPAIYSNYDFTYTHAFQNGWGLKVTPFEKIGTSLPTFYLLNPVLGIFAISNQGYNKTNGVEFEVTTPPRALGASGFLSMTYQNVLSTTPPLTTAETTVPLVPTATLALGDLYRAGYVSPFSIRLGGVENFKNGFSISPQLQYDIGYPYSFGNLIAAQVAPGVYANIPQVNFGPGVSGGLSTIIGTAPGTAISTNYVDPADPGTSLHPNIAWTRGTQGTSATGGFLSHGNLFATTTFQWTHGRNTLGVQLTNLFGNAFVNSVPAVNPWYQPLANGLAGPQTGYNTCVAQVGAGRRGCTAWIPKDTYAYSNGAYLLTNGDFTASPGLAPLIPFNAQFFWQLKL